MVTVLFARFAPLGDAAMVNAASAAASATVGPAPGPTWLTRSKLVVSHCRGKSLPSLPSLIAKYSRPNSVAEDRKSTRLNSSHLVISYAVFCLIKKNILAQPLFRSLSDARTRTRHLIRDISI